MTYAQARARGLVELPPTKHTCGGPVFGKLAPYGQCPRCDELHRGEAPRQWQGSQWRGSRRNGLPSALSSNDYCTCGHSNLWDDRCPKCGKRPYTD